MEENKEHPLPANTPPPPPPPYYFYPPMAHQEDEISLVDLWQVLIRQWKWIGASTVMAVVAAVAYLAAATPIYEAEAVLLPPEARHLQALNIPGINEVSLENAREEIYGEFTRNLRSSSLRRQFFDENNLVSILGGENPPAEDSVFREGFNRPLRVREGARDEAGFVFVSFQGESPELIAGWINDFIRLAARNTIDRSIEGVKAKIANEKEILREQIRIDREFAKQRRMDRIAVLEEQITIARDKNRRRDRIILLDEQIAIARQLNIVSRDDAPLRKLEGSGLGVAVSTAGEPLYMRGVKDLAAEKEALEKREDDDPFISGLRELIAEQEVLRKRKNDDPFIAGLRENQIRMGQMISGLEMLQTARADIYAARIDQRAVPPEYPVKPKKKIVLALSLVLGSMLGIFAAFFINFVQQQKERK